MKLGHWKTQILDDGRTAVTVDGALSAQFEPTVLVTDEGVEVLTLGANETPPATPWPSRLRCSMEREPGSGASARRPRQRPDTASSTARRSSGVSRLGAQRSHQLAPPGDSRMRRTVPRVMASVSRRTEPSWCWRWLFS